MTTIRMQRLDADGNPTGPVTVVEGELVCSPLMDPEPFDCTPITWNPRTVSFTAAFQDHKALSRYMLGSVLWAKYLRRQRHLARTVHVPKRRYKHGRKGVFR